MGIAETKQRTWRLAGLGVASLLMLGACADTGAEGEYDEVDPVAQIGLFGDGGARDAGAVTDAAGLDAAVRSDLGKGNGQDVVEIGDSWMSMFTNGDGIQGGMRRAGLRYRQYGVPGTRMLDNAIPNQFSTALRQNKDIKSVIMTGGGNDVLLNITATLTCVNKSCQTLKNITAALTKLWDRMGQAGVKDVVYIGYAEGAGSSPAEVTNSAKNGVGQACDAMTSIRCHWIDSTPIVRGRFVDGIHPTQAANDALAKAIIELMNKEGIRR